MKRDRHSKFVERRARKSVTYRKSFARALQQIDLALLVREMRENAEFTQTDLARKVGTTQSVIARLEDAEYMGHSLTMLERIATVCGVALSSALRKNPISSVRSLSFRRAGPRRPPSVHSKGTEMKVRKNRGVTDHSG